MVSSDNVVYHVAVTNATSLIGSIAIRGLFQIRKRQSTVLAKDDASAKFHQILSHISASTCVTVLVIVSCLQDV